MKYLTTIILAIASISAWAIEDDCGDQLMNIEQLRVIAPSDVPSSVYQKTLLLKFDKQCRGKNYAYIGIDNPAFDSILSMALAAYISKTPVYPAVITSETKEVGALSAERLLWLRFER